ncbi:MAG: hypothetical protein PWP30_2168 [Eubacteriaceae bacterium]|nr:hypothetical protein [Eubacteriaceae bacterium]
MKNKEIKESLKKAHLYQWQVAESLGISEPSLSRKMRHELHEDEKKQIFKVIEELKKEAV